MERYQNDEEEIKNSIHGDKVEFKKSFNPAISPNVGKYGPEKCYRDECWSRKRSKRKSEYPWPSC